MRDDYSWLAGLVVLVAVLASLAVAEGQPQPWTDHDVALGKLCRPEGSSSRADCIAIVEARGHYDLATLRRMHPRALAETRTDSRRWIAGLSASMQRPDGWPEDRIPWDDRGRAMWTATLETVRETMAGRLSVCTEVAQVWGSRTLDAERLARIMARGGREVCSGTRNQFVRFR
jgi:hypothetical protein